MEATTEEKSMGTYKEWKEYEEYYPDKGDQTAMERLADFISFVNSKSQKRAGEIIGNMLTNN